VESGGDVWAEGYLNSKRESFGPYQIPMPYYSDAVGLLP